MTSMNAGIWMTLVGVMIADTIGVDTFQDAEWDHAYVVLKLGRVRIGWYTSFSNLSVWSVR